MFGEYEASPSEDRDRRERIFQQIRRLILLHCDLEEDVIFPTLRNTGTERAARLVDEGRAGHGLLWKLLAELEPLDWRNPLLEAKMRVLRMKWEEYAAKEAATLFPEVHSMSPELRQSLRMELQRRRVHWLRRE